MPIKLKTNKATIALHMENGQRSILDLIVRNLMYVGETCIIEARDNGNYKDRTGNLRSSIGYVVVRDGSIVHKATTSGDESSQGGSQANLLLTQLAEKCDENSITLIVVAGMNYAAYVEANGYNVLTSAELLADQLVPSLLKQVGFEV